MCTLMNNKNIIRNKTNRLGIIITVAIVATVMIAGLTTSLGEHDAAAKGYLNKLQNRSIEQVGPNIPSDQNIAVNPDGSDEAPAPGENSCLVTINPYPCEFVTANGYCGVQDGAMGESYEVDCQTRKAK